MAKLQPKPQPIIVRPGNKKSVSHNWLYIFSCFFLSYYQHFKKDNNLSIKPTKMGTKMKARPVFKLANKLLYIPMCLSRLGRRRSSNGR
jgi:hypothetical protein